MDDAETERLTRQQLEHDTERMDRTREMFIPGGAPAPIPQYGGAEVVPVAAFRGDTKVSKDFVEKIASSAARSVEGVAELGGDVARFVNRALDRVGLTKVGDATRGVTARVDGINVDLTVVLVIRGDVKAADVTQQVRKRVIDDVEGYGMHVSNVTVKVDDIAI